MCATEVINRRLLLLAFIAIAVALWIAAANPIQQGDTSAKSATKTLARMSSNENLPLTVPEKLDRAQLEVANRDPFVALIPPPPKVVIAKAAKPSPPPLPTPPPLNMTFTGRMTAPDGSQLIFVNAGGNAVSLLVGQTLPNGYLVNSITDSAVELTYLPLKFDTRFDLPAQPKYEIR